MIHEKHNKKSLNGVDQKRISIREYADVLRDIHNRLVREGYFLDGIRIWNIFKCTSPMVEVEVIEENNV